MKEELTVPTDCNEKRVDVLLQREQTIQELQRLLESVTAERDDAWTELKYAYNWTCVYGDPFPTVIILSGQRRRS